MILTERGNIMDAVKNISSYNSQNLKNKVSFKGKKEVLYNLGKAINKAQYSAVESSTDSFSAMNAHIDAAVHDRFFPKFINNFKNHLKTKTDSYPGGLKKPMTLGQIAKFTDYFAPNSSKAKYEGFDNFQRHLIAETFEKNAPVDIKKVQEFLTAIKPN